MSERPPVKIEKVSKSCGLVDAPVYVWPGTACLL